MAVNRPPQPLRAMPFGEADPTREEVVEYIASLLGSLRSLAQDTELAFLAYLIGMAYEEAQAEKARQG